MSANAVWCMDVTCGELCFLYLTPGYNLRVRCCDLTGKLQLSQNYLGWEAWRFTPTPDGCIRISLPGLTQGYSCPPRMRVSSAPRIDGESPKSGVSKKVPPPGLYHSFGAKWSDFVPSKQPPTKQRCRKSIAIMYNGRVYNGRQSLCLGFGTGASAHLLFGEPAAIGTDGR